MHELTHSWEAYGEPQKDRTVGIKLPCKTLRISVEVVDIPRFCRAHRNHTCKHALSCEKCWRILAQASSAFSCASTIIVKMCCYCCDMQELTQTHHKGSSETRCDVCFHIFPAVFLGGCHDPQQELTNCAGVSSQNFHRPKPTTSVAHFALVSKSASDWRANVHDLPS